MKKLFVFVLMLLVVVGVASALPTPRSYFSFENDTISGSTIYDQSPSPNALDGVLLSNAPAPLPQVISNGALGDGMSFNHSGLNRIYIQDFAWNNENTLNVWLNISDQLKTNVIFTKHGVSSPGSNVHYSAYYIPQSGGELRVEIGNGGTKETEIFTNINLSDGNWNMLTITFSDTNDLVTVYKNGAYVANSTCTAAMSFQSTTLGGKIGSWTSQSASYNLNGSMDELSLWDEVLTQEDIDYLYDNGNGNPAVTANNSWGDGLIAAYTFEGDGINQQGFMPDLGVSNGDPTLVSGISGDTYMFDGNDGFSSGISYTEYGTVLQNFTISLWLNRNTTPATTYSIPFDNYYNSQNRIFFGSNPTPEFVRSNLRYNNVWSYLYYNNYNLTPETWTNVIITINNGYHEMWIDGVSANSSSSTDLVRLGQFFVGRDATAFGEYFWEGEIDELYMYNRTVNSTEVAYLSGGGCFFPFDNCTLPATCSVCDENCTPCGGGCNATNLSAMYSGVSSFDATYGDITGWNTSCITDMSQMFYNSDFNQDIDGWDVSSVTDMSQMFQLSDFNQDLTSWDTSSVTTMSQMFRDITTFNGNISTWDTSSLTDMSYMFQGCYAFDQDIGSWDTSKVTTMNALFRNALAFDQDIGSWNTSNVTNFQRTFNGAGTFNQDLNSWDTSKGTTMSQMFDGASAFNGNISTWDTGEVTSMLSMFGSASSFNQDISGWDTGKVLSMRDMFRRAFAFNQNISGWNTSSVTTMNGMFDAFTGTMAFDQDVGAWDVTSVTDMDDMFLNVNLTPSNYDGILTGWAAQSVQSGVSFDGGTSQYTSAATSARATLNTTYSWTITDGGLLVTIDQGYWADDELNQSTGCWRSDFINVNNIVDDNILGTYATPSCSGGGFNSEAIIDYDHFDNLEYGSYINFTYRSPFAGHTFRVVCDPNGAAEILDTWYYDGFTGTQSRIIILSQDCIDYMNAGGEQIEILIGNSAGTGNVQRIYEVDLWVERGCSDENASTECKCDPGLTQFENNICYVDGTLTLNQSKTGFFPNQIYLNENSVFDGAGYIINIGTPTATHTLFTAVGDNVTIQNLTHSRTGTGSTNSLMDQSDARTGLNIINVVQSATAWSKSLNLDNYDDIYVSNSQFLAQGPTIVDCTGFVVEDMNIVNGNFGGATITLSDVTDAVFNRTNVSEPSATDNPMISLMETDVIFQDSLLVARTSSEEAIRFNDGGGQNDVDFIDSYIYGIFRFDEDLTAAQHTVDAINTEFNTSEVVFKDVEVTFDNVTQSNGAVFYEQQDTEMSFVDWDQTNRVIRFAGNQSNMFFDVQSETTTIDWDFSSDLDSGYYNLSDVQMAQTWVFVEEGSYFDEQATVTFDQLPNAGSEYFVFKDGILQPEGTTYDLLFNDSNTLQIQVDGFSNWSLSLNSAPVIDNFIPPNTNVSAYTGADLYFYINASDLNNDTLYYSWYEGGSVFAGESLESFTWLSDYTDVGITNITGKVNDSIAEVSNEWNVSLSYYPTTLTPTVADKSATTIDVDWVSNADSMEVYVDDVLITTSVGASYLIEGLSPNTTYEIMLVPVKDGYYGEPEVFNATTDATDNNVPVMQAVSIAPTTVYTDTVVQGTCRASDVDTANIFYVYEWFVNNVSVRDGVTSVYDQGTTVNIGSLLSNNYVKSDNISLSCTPNDGIEAGISSETSLSVQNSQSEIAEIFLIQVNATSYLCNHTYVDADNDPEITPSYMWYKNGIDTGNTTLSVPISQFSAGDEIVCSVTTGDGIAANITDNSSIFQVGDNNPPDYLNIIEYKTSVFNDDPTIMQVECEDDEDNIAGGYPVLRMLNPNLVQEQYSFFSLGDPEEPDVYYRYITFSTAGTYTNLNVECCDGNGNCIDEDLEDVVSTVEPIRVGGSSGGGGVPEEDFREIVSFDVNPNIVSVNIPAGSTLLQELEVSNQDIIDIDFTAAILRGEDDDVYEWMSFEGDRKAITFTIAREGGLASNNKFLPYTIAVPAGTPEGTYRGLVEVNGLEQTEQVVIEVNVGEPVFTNLLGFFERELFTLPFTAEETPTGQVTSEGEVITATVGGTPFRVWHLIVSLVVLALGTIGYFRLRKKAR